MRSTPSPPPPSPSPLTYAEAMCTNTSEMYCPPATPRQPETETLLPNTQGPSSSHDIQLTPNLVDSSPTAVSPTSYTIALWQPPNANSHIHRGLPNITDAMCYLLAAFHPLAILYKPLTAINQPLHNLLRNIQQCITASTYPPFKQRMLSVGVADLVTKWRTSVKPNRQDDVTTVIPLCLDGLNEEAERALGRRLEFGPCDIQLLRTFHCPTCSEPTTKSERLTTITFNLNEERHRNLSIINSQTAADSVLNDNEYRLCECEACGDKREGPVTWSPGYHTPQMIVLQINRGIKLRGRDRKLYTPIDTDNLTIIISGETYELSAFSTHFGESVYSGHWKSGILQAGGESSVIDDHQVGRSNRSETRELISEASALFFQLREDHVNPAADHSTESPATSLPSTVPVSLATSLHSTVNKPSDSVIRQPNKILPVKNKGTRSKGKNSAHPSPTASPHNSTHHLQTPSSRSERSDFTPQNPIEDPLPKPQRTRVPRRVAIVQTPTPPHLQAQTPPDLTPHFQTPTPPDLTPHFQTPTPPHLTPQLPTPPNVTLNTPHMADLTPQQPVVHHIHKPSSQAPHLSPQDPVTHYKPSSQAPHIPPSQPRPLTPHTHLSQPPQLTPDNIDSSPQALSSPFPESDLPHQAVLSSPEVEEPPPQDPDFEVEVAVPTHTAPQQPRKQRAPMRINPAKQLHPIPVSVPAPDFEEVEVAVEEDFDQLDPIEKIERLRTQHQRELLRNNYTDILFQPNNPIMNAGKEFHQSVQSYEWKQCSTCPRNYPYIKINSRTGKCETCSKKKESKYFCPENKMDPGKDVDLLLRLSPIEQAAIAIFCPAVQVYKLGMHSSAAKGHCVSFVQNVSELSTVLPQKPEHIPVLAIIPPRRADQPNQPITDRRFMVRRNYLIQALRWLKLNNPEYKDIVISNENIDQYIIEDDILQNPPIVYTEHNIQFPAQQQDNPETVPEEATSVDVPIPQRTVAENIVTAVTEGTDQSPNRQQHPIQPQQNEDVHPSPLNWPTRERALASEFEHGYYSKAFAPLFPTGAGDITKRNEHPYKVPLLDYFQFLLQSHRRFARHHLFPFVAASIYRRHKGMTLSNVFAEKGAANLTIREI